MTSWEACEMNTDSRQNLGAGNFGRREQVGRTEMMPGEGCKSAKVFFLVHCFKVREPSFGATKKSGDPE